MKGVEIIFLRDKIAGILVLFVAIAIAFSQASGDYFTCIKSKNYCSIGTKNIFTQIKKRTAEFPLSFIKNIEIKEKVEKLGSKNRTKFELYLLTKNAAYISLLQVSFQEQAQTKMRPKFAVI